MRPYRLHVLYEHGFDLRPYSCSHIRLLRPLSHPSISDSVQLSAGPELCEEHVDVVAVDRRWKSTVTAEQAERLVETVSRRGSRLLYSLDDHLLAFEGERQDSEGSSRGVVETFLHAADHVLVTTENLRAVIEPYNRRVTVIPNFLDERLLGERPSAQDFMERLTSMRKASEREGRATKIGYMGTLTHASDLEIITAALQEVCERHGGRVRLELVGGVEDAATSALMRELPWVIIDPGPIFTEYPSFLPWFAAMCRWDIALAPLADNVFTQCKSDIKFLDYAAIRTTGIFSNVPAYASTLQGGVTGFLADNTAEAWEEVLERALADRLQCMIMGYLAQDYLHGSRTLATGAIQWLDLIRRCMGE